jgi:hypothetical protein
MFKRHSRIITSGIVGFGFLAFVFSIALATPETSQNLAQEDINKTISDDAYGRDLMAFIPGGYSITSPAFAPFSKLFLGDEDSEIVVSGSAVEDKPASIVRVDDAQSTKDVLIGSFTFYVSSEVKRKVELEDVTLEVSTDDDDIGDVLDRLYMVYEGDTLDSESVGSGGSTEEVEFTNLDLDVDEGSAVDIEIFADFESANDYSNQTEFSWLINDKNDVDTSPGFRGRKKFVEVFPESFVLYDAGLVVEFVSTDGVRSPGPLNTPDDVGVFQTEIEITPFGDDVYISSEVASRSKTDAHEVQVYLNQDPVVGRFSSKIESLDGLQPYRGNYFKIPEDETHRFLIEVEVDNARRQRTGIYTFDIQDIKWSDTPPYSQYAVWDLDSDDFESRALYLD